MNVLIHATNAVKDKNGKFITDPSKKLDRWKEHFEELLNPEVTNTINASEDNVAPCDNSLFIDAPLYPPTREEIKSALLKLKNYKASGYDEISNGQLRYGNDATVETMLPILSTNCGIKNVFQLTG